MKSQTWYFNDVIIDFVLKLASKKLIKLSTKKSNLRDEKASPVFTVVRHQKTGSGGAIVAVVTGRHDDADVTARDVLTELTRYLWKQRQIVC